MHLTHARVNIQHVIYNNITAAWAVDREFVYIVLALLDLPLAPFGVPLGSLWPSFGIPLAVLGHLWDPFGAPWAALGRLLEIGRHFPSKCSPFAMPAHKNKPPGIHIPVILVPRKWCHEVLLGAPLPHAPGVRMT